MIFLVNHLPADDKVCDNLHFSRGKYDLIFLVNHLPADDSHEILSLIWFLKKLKKKKKMSAATVRWHLKSQVKSIWNIINSNQKCISE